MNYVDLQRIIMTEVARKFQVKNIQKIEDGSIITINGSHVIQEKKSVKWTMAKDDVTPQDIFNLSKGSNADRAKVAKYCIQDCNLVHHLMNKIDVVTGYVEMASICSVPIRLYSIERSRY